MMREQEQTKVQVSTVQIIAGALASVSAAVVASTFGLKGTLLGAAVTSIVASVGSALYTHSLHRARARIQTRFNPHTGAIERVVIRPQRMRRPIRWGRVAGVAALVFVLAMGAITVVEVAARRPVAALVGSTSPQHGETTVGTLLQNAPGAAPITIPTILTSPTPAGTMTATPNGTPSTSPTPGGTVTMTPNGTGTIPARPTLAETPAATPNGTPITGTASHVPASTATSIRSPGATPTAAAQTAPPPAHTPTATPHTGTTPTATAAKSSPTTPTAPAPSPPAPTTAANTPHETPQP
jgi:hypothetical protein